MEGRELIEVSNVVKATFDYNELSRLLLALNRRVEDYAPALSPYPDQVVAVLKRAEAEGWLPDLIAAMVRERPNRSEVLAFLRVNRGWDPARVRPAGHPSEAVRVFGGKLFIGRSKLRRHLRTMSDPEREKVLLVTSDERKVGKTYSKVLVEYLSNRQGSGLVYVDLDRDQYDPGKLTSALARGLRLSVEGMPAQAQQQHARWNQELVEYLVRPETLAAGWWIILDGFRDQVPSEPIQDFVSQLSKRVQDTPPLYRLILANYTYPLPFDVHALTLNEHVSPIAKAEVEAFLSQVHERAHAAPPDAEALLEYVDGVYEEAASYKRAHAEVDELTLLRTAVSNAVKVIEGEV